MIQYGFVVLMLAFVLTGCGQKNNDIKVYENTEEVSVRHEETSMTAIITSMDMENNQMHFVSVLDGTDITLQYHGGVRVSDTKGTDIGIDSVVCGNVVDIVYYADTEKLVSIAKNAKVKTYTQVKLSVKTLVNLIWMLTHVRKNTLLTCVLAPLTKQFA